MKKRSLQLLVVALLLSVSNVFAQNGIDKKPEYLWAVNGSMGYSLLWGDAASQEPNPFSRWFSDESAFSYGLTLHRKLNNTFKIQSGLVYGNLNSIRDVWSDDIHPKTTAQTTYFDGHIGINVDFTSMFGAKPERLISFYGLVGVGMAYYSATSQLDGIDIEDRKVSGANTLFIPWGWGLDFRINDKFHITFENTFRHTFVDDFDAYEGGNSKFSDFYSITGLGLTYKFGEKREKKQPEIEIEPVDPQENDSAVASNDEPVKEFVVVSYKANIPAKVTPNSEYQVNSIINKGELSGVAEYTMNIPEDIYITDIITNGGNVKQDSAVYTISWNDMPKGNLMISYKLSTGGLDKERYTIKSKFTYEEEGEEKVKVFTNTMLLEAPVIASKELDKVKESQKEVVPVVPVVPVVKEPKKTIEYRVQVAASFGGTVSKGLLKKRLGLTESVKEDPYKNSYRYTVGSYSSYGEAAQNKALSKVRGSYVVVFKNGKYVGGLDSVNKDIMDQDGVFASGETYKVQIAGSKGKPYPISRLAYKYGLKESDITEDEVGGWFNYSFGKYKTSAEAKPALKNIRNKVPKAYIIKFVNGKR